MEAEITIAQMTETDRETPLLKREIESKVKVEPSILDREETNKIANAQLILHRIETENLMSMIRKKESVTQTPLLPQIKSALLMMINTEDKETTM
jgi:hypothetical protein